MQTLFFRLLARDDEEAALRSASATVNRGELAAHVFHITYRVEEPRYIVRYADIPEIITSGATLTEAFCHACEALDLHLESMQKLGLPLPEPRHRLTMETV